MKKTGKDFRLNKQTKVMLALSKFKSEQDRSNFKKAMVDAQSSSEKIVRDDQRDKSGQ